MMARKQTAQEKFWAGEFGDSYIERNSIAQTFASRTALWGGILSHCEGMPASAFEMGCNIGANLCVLRGFSTSMKLTAVEINEKACEIARQNVSATINNCSIMDYSTENMFELVFSCGVLIHINPEQLQSVYKKLYSLSSKYILLSEYYNPSPTQVTYRGHSEKLFKRDFAGEMLDIFPDLRLVAYKFVYHRDPVFPLDDTTWFLMEKKQNCTATSTP